VPTTIGGNQILCVRVGSAMDALAMTADSLSAARGGGC
jgi:hypothetical protein